MLNRVGQEGNIALLPFGGGVFLDQEIVPVLAGAGEKRRGASHGSRAAGAQLQQHGSGFIHETGTIELMGLRVRHNLALRLDAQPASVQAAARFAALKQLPDCAALLLPVPAMKSLTEHLWFEVPSRRGFVNITRAVQDLIGKSGVQEGLCLVNAMHITSSVFINDAEEGLLHDYEVWLETLAPHEPVGRYHHNRTGEDNADAHLKRQIMGREVVVAITKGKADFGPWEQIFYGEFDGRRKKRVLVKIIGE